MRGIEQVAAPRLPDSLPQSAPFALSGVEQDIRRELRTVVVQQLAPLLRPPESGAAGSAHVDQAGSTNRVRIEQSAVGNATSAVVVQGGSSQRADVDQRGATSSLALVAQADTHTGSRGTVNQEQSTLAVALIGQGPLALARLNHVALADHGSKSLREASTLATGEGAFDARATINQSGGAGQAAVLVQTARGAEATINQTGSHQVATLVQAGGAHRGTINQTQSGTLLQPATVTLAQYGETPQKMTITQDVLSLPSIKVVQGLR